MTDTLNIEDINEILDRKKEENTEVEPEKEPEELN